MRVNNALIVKTRESQGVLQKDLARKAGVAVSTLSGVECGRTCTYETAVKIANALGMQLEDLVIM